MEWGEANPKSNVARANDKECASSQEVESALVATANLVSVLPFLWLAALSRCYLMNLFSQLALR